MPPEKTLILNDSPDLKRISNCHRFDFIIEIFISQFEAQAIYTHDF